MIKYPIAILIAVSLGWAFRSTLGSDSVTDRKAGDVAQVALPRKQIHSPGAILTNIHEPSTTWIRLELSYVFENAVQREEAERITSELTQDTILFLRTLNLKSLEGSLGLVHLREDLLVRARTRLPEKPIDIYIRTMVIQ